MDPATVDNTTTKPHLTCYWRVASTAPGRRFKRAFNALAISTSSIARFCRQTILPISARPNICNQAARSPPPSHHQCSRQRPELDPSTADSPFAPFLFPARLSWQDFMRREMCSGNLLTRRSLKPQRVKRAARPTCQGR